MPTHGYECVELNTDLVSNLLNNTKRPEDRRLIMPLLWNTKVNIYWPIAIIWLSVLFERIY